MRILALIPARSGSRGLRHKNIQEVGGVPMLVRAVRLALASRRRGEEWSVVVSTDAPRYARLARAAGAEVPFLRPARLATSRARLIEAVLHTVDGLALAGRSFDAVLLLSAATPLTAVRDVRRALALFRRHGVSVASVTADPVPDAWRFRVEAGRLCGSRRARIGRRQEAAAGFRLNGAVYVASPAWLRRHRQFLVAGRTAALAMPRCRSVDVEDDLDLAWARLLCDSGVHEGRRMV